MVLNIFKPKVEALPQDNNSRRPSLLLTAGRCKSFCFLILEHVLSKKNKIGCHHIIKKTFLVDKELRWSKSGITWLDNYGQLIFFLGHTSFNETQALRYRVFIIGVKKQ